MHVALYVLADQHLLVARKVEMAQQTRAQRAHAGRITGIAGQVLVAGNLGAGNRSYQNNKASGRH